jgi:hypothetical protein
MRFRLCKSWGAFASEKAASELIMNDTFGGTPSKEAPDDILHRPSGYENRIVQMNADGANREASPPAFKK